MMTRTLSLVTGIALWCLAGVAMAQVPQYGANVNAEQARKGLAAALAEARKLNIPMAVAVVDTAGQLVAFERLDNTQIGSIAVALAAGLEGTVVLWLALNREGTIEETIIVSGAPEFAAAVESALPGLRIPMYSSLCNTNTWSGW